MKNLGGVVVVAVLLVGLLLLAWCASQQNKLGPITLAAPPSVPTQVGGYINRQWDAPLISVASIGKDFFMGIPGEYDFGATWEANTTYAGQVSAGSFEFGVYPASKCSEMFGSRALRYLALDGGQAWVEASYIGEANLGSSGNPVPVAVFRFSFSEPGRYIIGDEEFVGVGAPTQVWLVKW